MLALECWEERARRPNPRRKDEQIACEPGWTELPALCGTSCVNNAAPAADAHRPSLPCSSLPRRCSFAGVKLCLAVGQIAVAVHAAAAEVRCSTAPNWLVSAPSAVCALTPGEIRTLNTILALAASHARSAGSLRNRSKLLWCLHFVGLTCPPAHDMQAVLDGQGPRLGRL